MKKKKLETPISCEEQLNDFAKAGRRKVGIHDYHEQYNYYSTIGRLKYLQFLYPSSTSDIRNNKKDYFSRLEVRRQGDTIIVYKIIQEFKTDKQFLQISHHKP